MLTVPGSFTNCTTRFISGLEGIEKQKVGSARHPAAVTLSPQLAGVGASDAWTTDAAGPPCWGSVVTGASP